MNTQKRTMTFNMMPKQGGRNAPNRMGRRDWLRKAMIGSGVLLGASALPVGAYYLLRGEKQTPGVSLEGYTVTAYMGGKGAKSLRLSECIRDGQQRPAIIVFTLPEDYPREDPQCKACLQAAERIYGKYSDVPVLGIRVTGPGEGGNPNGPGEIAERLGVTYPMVTMDAKTYEGLRAALRLETVRVLATNWEQRAVFHTGGRMNGGKRMENNLTAVLKMIHGNQSPRKYVNLPAGVQDAPQETAVAKAGKGENGAARDNAPEGNAEANPAKEATPGPAEEPRKPDGRMEPMKPVDEGGPVEAEPPSAPAGEAPEGQQAENAPAEEVQQEEAEPQEAGGEPQPDTDEGEAPDEVAGGEEAREERRARRRKRRAKRGREAAETKGRGAGPGEDAAERARVQKERDNTFLDSLHGGRL